LVVGWWCRYPLSEKDALILGSLQLQEECKGANPEELDVLSYLDEYLPPPFLDNADDEKLQQLTARLKELFSLIAHYSPIVR